MALIKKHLSTKNDLNQFLTYMKLRELPDFCGGEWGLILA